MIGLSADSLHFDTVFTKAGSTTRLIKVFNRYDRKLLIHSIALSGGIGSAFKLNINGQAGPEQTDLELAANDSLYVFVQVTIDPTSSNTPFVVRDSISIRLNGHEQWVQLDAYGQNAHYLPSQHITGEQNWVNDLPYIITGTIQVDEGATLTIHKGARLYFHGGSGLEISGTLQALGGDADTEKVVFLSDRLDEPYKNLPGSWNGIVFTETSTGNLFRAVTLKHAQRGIVLKRPAASGYQLEMEKSVIDNCSEWGIRSNGSAFKAVNCLFSNSGRSILIENGGDYLIQHCTIAGFTTKFLQHKEASVSISDHDPEMSGTTGNSIKAIFENCILWGEDGFMPTEIRSDRSGNQQYEVEFKNSIVRTGTLDPNLVFTDCLLNTDPLFRNTGENEGLPDFHLLEGSPAINAGADIGIVNDLENNNREAPDLGCYEYLP